MSPANATLSGWGSLPVELKTKVYRLLLIAGGPITPGQPISLSAQFLRCNKTIYDEAHSLLWNNVFDIGESRVSQRIWDISKPEKDRLKLESSPEHLPIILWSRQVRHVQVNRRGISGYYLDSILHTLTVMPMLESVCLNIWEDSGLGVSHGLYWTKGGPSNSYEVRGLTKRFLVRVGECLIKQYPPVKFYLAMTTLQGKILRWQAQHNTSTESGSCITFIDRTPEQELLVHESRYSLGPPSKKLVMDGPVIQSK